MSSPLSIIRSRLDSHEQLSIEDFAKSALVNRLYISDDPNSREVKVYYLHYLVMLGSIEAIRAFLLSLSPDELSEIVNDNNAYHFWMGTPMHTAVDWNDNERGRKVVDLLMEFKAIPTKTNYYGNTPGQNIGSWIIPSLDFDFSLRDHSDDGSEDGEQQEYSPWYKRVEEDFGELNNYVQKLIRDYQPEGGPSTSTAQGAE